MRNKRRETILKIVGAGVVGLFLLDRMILSPAVAGWREQSERIGTLRQKVERGRQLLERESSIRARWDQMINTDLPDDRSVAESDIFKAIGRWTEESGVSFTSLAPDWRKHEAGDDLYEFRASALGDQTALAKLVYALEIDPLPTHIHDLELNTRDAKGKQLMLSLRFSFLRLTAAAETKP